MTRITLSSFAAAVLVATLAAPLALANGRIDGRLFSLAMTGFPEEVTAGGSITGTILLQASTGMTGTESATIQTWVETPFGRAYLSQETRSIAPNRTVRVPVAHEVMVPVDVEPFTARLGVSVTIKGETLEMTHDVRILPSPR